VYVALEITGSNCWRLVARTLLNISTQLSSTTYR